MVYLYIQIYTHAKPNNSTVTTTKIWDNHNKKLWKSNNNKNMGVNNKNMGQSIKI